MYPENSTGPLCERDPERDPAWCAYHRTEHAPDERPEVEVTVTVVARVIPGYGPEEVGDVIRFHLQLSDLNSVEADISAVHITSMHEVRRPIRPGDMVERLGTELDAREVLSVGRDWLTLDLLGQESPRLPLDNYRTIVPADGSL